MPWVTPASSPASRASSQSDCVRPERTELKTIRETYRALLAAEAGDAEAQRLVDLMARINRYEVADPDSEAACDEAFAKTMALPHQEPAAAN